MIKEIFLQNNFEYKGSRYEGTPDQIDAGISLTIENYWFKGHHCEVFVCDGNSDIEKVIIDGTTVITSVPGSICATKEQLVDYIKNIIYGFMSDEFEEEARKHLTTPLI